ncbi:hypothetical protein [Geomicrobium sediminis]|uniref:Two-component system sensor histidine kinase KdpD n=1 Tax=Geomicrobium sediminis TaxID=1347788 RepID=A0ABS2PG01_9BACL|nr:hypothetical protein [Geomicrobium sediminis]MBM7634350.1 two-component system sensor histidine kinase KdpD [Geomicrobium sediminis]
MLSSSKEHHTLVCVQHGKNGLRFIEKALQTIDHASHHTTIFLFDNMACEEDEAHRIVGMSLFQKLALKYEADLLISEGKPLTNRKLIAETAKEVQATHLIVGQSIESLWRKWIGKSTIDHLSKDIPSVNVHMIPREHAHEEEDWTFDKGVDAYLFPIYNGTYLVDFHPTGDESHEGVFFKHRHTDFNNGRFAFYDDERITEAHVRKGIIHELTDHFEQQA